MVPLGVSRRAVDPGRVRAGVRGTGLRRHRPVGDRRTVVRGRARPVLGDAGVEHPDLRTAHRGRRDLGEPAPHAPVRDHAVTSGRRVGGEEVPLQGAGIRSGRVAERIAPATTRPRVPGAASGARAIQILVRWSTRLPAIRCAIHMRDHIPSSRSSHTWRPSRKSGDES